MVLPLKTNKVLTHTLYSWDKPYPSYYFLNADVPQRFLKKHGSGTVPGSTVYDVIVENGLAPAAAIQYDPNSSSPLSGLTKITQSAMDVWLEEDEKVLGIKFKSYEEAVLDLVGQFLQLAQAEQK